MANDMKSGVGFIIPAAGVVGFFTSLLLGEFLLSIIIAISGILVWFIYMLVMESHMPKEMGNMIILFGLLLSLGIFFGFGLTYNMWGGFELQAEGSIFSLIILFFSVITGLTFRNQGISTLQTKDSNITGVLSDSDRDLVMNAINKTNESSKNSNEPKVIVVKQDSTPETKSENNEQETKAAVSPSPYDPYGMTTNPYFAYPPDYYYDEDDDEDEYEDEYEDDWDDDYDDENK